MLWRYYQKYTWVWTWVNEGVIQRNGFNIIEWMLEILILENKKYLFINLLKSSGFVHVVE